MAQIVQRKHEFAIADVSCSAVTNAGFAPVNRLLVVPLPLARPRLVSLHKSRARHGRHPLRFIAYAQASVCGTVRDVAFWLRFVKCSTAPPLHLPLPDPQTEAVMFNKMEITHFEINGPFSRLPC